MTTFGEIVRTYHNRVIAPLDRHLAALEVGVHDQFHRQGEIMNFHASTLKGQNNLAQHMEMVSKGWLQQLKQAQQFDENALSHMKDLAIEDIRKLPIHSTCLEGFLQKNELVNALSAIQNFNIQERIFKNIAFGHLSKLSNAIDKSSPTGDLKHYWVRTLIRQFVPAVLLAVGIGAAFTLGKSLFAKDTNTTA